MACSEFLSAVFVKCDYVISEIIYSTAHVHHRGPCLIRPVVCSMLIGAPPESGGNYCCITAVSVESATRRTTECLLLWLLCQQERRKCLQLLWPLQSSSSCSCTLPWVQRTVCTVRYSKTVGVTIRISGCNWRGQQDTQEVRGA